jgi:hypothetical protein
VTPTTRKIALLVGLGALVVALLAWQIVRLTRPRPFHLQSARITQLDRATRSGELEFVHPKSGRTTTVTARNIPADCAVSIDGVRADLSDLRVGDIVAVRGLFYPADQSARPQEIRATRPPATAPSVPAAAPVAGTP